ncbi:2-C-methyl-D-erythritol 4-phosphate cytidylyltransferase [Kaarinaea lacus]
MSAESPHGSSRYWAVVPAAGSGARMGAEKPKQYLSLLNIPIIQHTLESLLRHPKIRGAVVAIASGDPYWHSVNIRSDKQLLVVTGGKERCHSVINALEALSVVADTQDWVLVHDAARPCIRQEDIDNLIVEVSEASAGGLLAVPVHDTIKRSGDNGMVEKTVDRRHLWHAQTPQMFPLITLREALTKALQDNFLVTDEASAMEHLGYNPKLVEGHADNIKVTRPEDLPLAEFYLKRMEGTMNREAG